MIKLDCIDAKSVVRGRGEDSHYQSQEYIASDFRFSGGIDFWAAQLGEEVVRVLARDVTIDFEFDGLPVPEPACADGEDDAWDP